MSEFIVNSAFFGITLSFVIYMAFYLIKERFKIANPLFNPLLLASAVIIVILCVCHIDYDVYNKSAGIATKFITPLTICLAVPLYRQVEILKKNIAAIVIAIFAGCVGHALVLCTIAVCVKLDPVLLHSVMPKSVTTAIALGLSGKIGGVESVTIVGVTIAGMTGAVLGPVILKLFKINEPIAAGLAMGTASHAVGTSKAMEMGKVQGAMSSLAIVVTGILTVIIVPIAAKIIG